MIPKIIHQIWLGPKDPPMQWIETWKSAGCEYKLWTEKEIRDIYMHNQKIYDMYLERKVYHGAADIVRTEILLQEGGIYIDADCERLKDIPIYLFEKCFFAVESPKRGDMWNYRVANGVIGCAKGESILKDYIEEISKLKKFYPPWRTVGGTTLTKVLLKHKDRTDIEILPSYMFYPVSLDGVVDPRSKDAISTHYHGETKGLY